MASMMRSRVGRRMVSTSPLSAVLRKTKPGSLNQLKSQCCRSQAGKLWIITDLPKGAADPVWSPDSKRIAFLSSTTPEDIEKAQRKKNSSKNNETRESKGSKNTAQLKQPEPESEHESDVHVISRAVYRSDDEGYLDPKRHEHIWVLDVPTTSDELTNPVQLTRGDFDEHEVVWSHKNSRIYFLTQRIDEPYYELPTTDIY